MARVPVFAPRYNISPTKLAGVIYRERREPAVKLMRWGLIPSWAKDESVGNALINARSETLESLTKRILDCSGKMTWKTFTRHGHALEIHWFTTRREPKLQKIS